MSTATVIPWGPRQCRHRDDALEWALERHAAPIYLGIGGDPWIKADAVAHGLETVDDDVVVIADADVWTPGIESAVLAITAGVAEWAVPHRAVYRLTEGSTKAVLEGRDWRDAVLGGLELERRPYGGYLGGGVVVALREVLEAVPLDRRFVGWGQEDECWGIALTMLAGAPWRGTAPLVHLYHPPAPRIDARKGSLEGWALCRRYHAANFDVEAMTELVAEGAK